MHSPLRRPGVRRIALPLVRCVLKGPSAAARARRADKGTPVAPAGIDAGGSFVTPLAVDLGTATEANDVMGVLITVSTAG